MFAIEPADVYRQVAILKWVVGVSAILCLSMLAWVWVRQEQKKRMHDASNRKLDEMIKVVREYLHVAGLRAEAAIDISKGSRAVAASLVREGKDTLGRVVDTVKDAAEKAAEVIRTTADGKLVPDSKHDG